MGISIASRYRSPNGVKIILLLNSVDTHMISKKYFAEGIGTFALSFIVLSAVSYTSTLPLVIPVIAGLTLGLFVYSIGAISGCHINPAVTLGLLSIKKITSKDAAFYIIAQFLGAMSAVVLAGVFMMTHAAPSSGTPFELSVFLAEMLGTAFFTFGIASVVYGNVKDEASGLVIGGSLLFGILLASLAGASGILNPAVALALNSLSLTYILAPIAGSIFGFQAYKFVAGK